MEKILEVKDLSVDLEGENILQEIHFEIEQGQTFVILGPNGAGKTILLRTLLGLLPYRGQVLWKKDVRIGYVPQRVSISKEMPLTVKDFLGLKGISRDEAALSLLQVGLPDPAFLNKRIGKISSGQFQRILIAWALAGNPDVLLFDEPTAGIDIGGEETVYGLLQKIQKEKGLTIVLVTHDLSIVYRQATHVLCLNKRMICYGPPKSILTVENLQETYGGGIKYFTHDHE
jgi:zinc transport system ATP-binding protein